MDMMIIIMHQILIMIIMMLVGFLTKKINLLSNIGVHEITNILLYIITPVVIIDAYTIPYTSDKAEKLLVCFILSIFIHLFFICIARLIFKGKGVDQNAVILSNSGFMGIPLIMAVLGQDSVFFLSAYMAVNAIVQWTYGVAVLDADYRFDVKKVLFSPIMISSMAALLIFFLQLPLPNILLSSFDYIKNLNTPLAMIVLGSYITQVNFRMIYKNIRSILKPVIYRLILLPLSCLPGLLLIPESLYEIKVVHLILVSAPTAISVALFSEKYGQDTPLAVQIICLSTILCLFTIPLLVLLFTLLSF